MDLRACKFFYSGSDLNFSVFSETSCRAKYNASVSLPLIQTAVEVYEIEPAADCQWVVVEQRDGDKRTQRIFVRQQEEFVETLMRDLPKTLKLKLARRLEKSAGVSQAVASARSQHRLSRNPAPTKPSPRRASPTIRRLLPSLPS
jgi:hypothetical protein